MAKVIAGRGELPFSIGGFCVPVANINGVIKNNINIFRQRSDNTFDLVDTDGNIFSFIRLTYTDKDGQYLDTSASDSVLSTLLGKNTFFMRIDQAFVTSFQTHKIKLSSGESIYKPWDLYFCNAPPPPSVLDLDFVNKDDE